MRTTPPVSAANTKQTISREWLLEGEDFLFYLLVPDFGLIAPAVPMSMVPDREMGWYPGTGLPTLRPCQRPCWGLGIWAQLYRAVDVLVLSPWGCYCHKFYSSQMLQTFEAWLERGAGLGTRGCAVTAGGASAEGAPVVEQEVLSSLVPAARWGEASREVTPTCYHHPAIAAYVS